MGVPRYKKKAMPGERVPVQPDYSVWNENRSYAAPPNPPGEKMDKLDKASAVLWNILSGLGGMLKEDVQKLKADPVGSIRATADAYTIGQEARDSFRRGDYGGAIVRSGLGEMLALPEMQRATQGKAGLADLGWLAATYTGGPLAKVAKNTKKTLSRGSQKAMLDVLSRLPK